ncbi:unnamed protein product [Effrenium voratum]|nr:unnamed protein product [Effrenium voratum]
MFAMRLALLALQLSGTGAFIPDAQPRLPRAGRNPTSLLPQSASPPYTSNHRHHRHCNQHPSSRSFGTRQSSIYRLQKPPQREQVPKDAWDKPTSLPSKSILTGMLAFLAGATNAIVFTKYKCYSNMMTGNSIMVGEGLATLHWAKFAFVSSMVGHYVAGVAIFRLLDSKLGLRRVIVTAPLVLLLYLAADAWSGRFDTIWHVPLLALAAGLANAFSSSTQTVVTNMLTGHWNTIGNFLGDLMSGKGAKGRSAAKRSLGITTTLLLGVVAGATLMEHGVNPRQVPDARFWWLGAAYACVFAWYDGDFVSVFNGYDGVLDYYRDLSLAADDKWRKVSIPLLAVAARDDPITHCDALRAQEFSSKNPQLLFLITDRGGHVGWPWGMQPWKRGWDFINEAIQVFITAVDSQEGLEGVLLAELDPKAEAAAFLPTLQLLTLLLAERLTSLHWEAEAHRSEAVINRLLQGVDVLAKPSEEWEKNLMQRAAEVPKEVLRGDVTLQEAAVWQPNQRSYVNV